jgi:hypothetical protein
MTLQTAHQKLQEHREAARQADARQGEVRLERDRAQRVVSSAEAELGTYFGLLERGAKPDAPREKVLKAALEKARDAAGVEWDARAQAAAELVAEAEQAVMGFIASNVDALAAELAEEAVGARDRLMEAVDALNEAESRWLAVRARWSPLMASRNVPPGELPPSPLNGATGALAEAMAPLHSGQPRHPSRLLPVPRSWLPEGERPPAPEEDGVVRERTLPYGEAHLAGRG